MLVQVFENPIHGGIKKDDIKQMVRHYRGANVLKKKMKYAHFRLEDVLELFVKNEVLPKKIIDLINNDAEVKSHIKKYGLKIYLGKHKIQRTCPTDGQAKPEDYLNKVTTILCNTDLKESTVLSGPFKGFKDMLKDNKFLLVGAERATTTDPGDGLDQAEIAPPFNAADEEIYDIDNNPKP
ncbi:hypothetical protein [Pedobacter sp. ASV12]|uniref:hypothetical protein n=1 Tax=Pedobacter sp. ASV12 TaxID=2795120 RepID=UPI0018EBF39E|nr:hypothetical protein [Pedobacter sp. ASV12]